MPVQVTAKVEDGKVRQSLKSLGSALPNVGRRRLKSTLEEASYEASGGYMGGSSYALVPPVEGTGRTGEYGSSFQVVDNGGVSYSLVADAKRRGEDYTHFVGGYSDGTGQAWMHVGRWPLIGPTVTKWLNSLLQELDADLSQLLRSLGLGL